VSESFLDHREHRFHIAEVKLVQLVIAETFSDIPSGVHIRVFNVAAVQAPKLGLRGSIVLMHKPANGALLTGISRLHGAIPNAGFVQNENSNSIPLGLS